MKIPIGNIGGKEYVITSDNLNIILNVQKVAGSESKEPGKEYLEAEAFFCTIGECIASVVQRGLRASQAVSLAELKEDVARIEREIKEKVRL